MNYRELLENVGKFGYGVFSNTMIEDLGQREALGMFVSRNPDFFNSFEGRHGDLVIRNLTPKGMKHFGIEGKLSRSENWHSFLDMLTINSYMLELDAWASYSTKPHQIIIMNGKKVGMISMRWGMPPGYRDIDTLLASPHYLDIIEANKIELHQDTIGKIHVPKSLRYLRKGLV